MAKIPVGAPPVSADEALRRLMEGNQRFLRGEARSHSFRKETAADLVKGQYPYAMVLGCSDSRVPPEVLFDAGLGELFVVRVAGNVMSPEVAGSLQYAASHLHTPLLMVLGHEGCGAVGAALATRRQGAPQRRRIQILLESIIPGLPPDDPTATPSENLARAVESNVRWVTRSILEAPEGQARLAEGRMKMVGAVYEIETGRVRIIERMGERVGQGPSL